MQTKKFEVKIKTQYLITAYQNSVISLPITAYLLMKIYHHNNQTNHHTEDKQMI